MHHTIDTAALTAAQIYAALVLDVVGDDDSMDAPSDWDAGTVTFDPYV